MHEEDIDDVTEKFEVAESPDDLNSEGLVIKYGNSSTAIQNLPKDFGIIYSAQSAH